jgi:hypothetical protein
MYTCVYVCVCVCTAIYLSIYRSFYLSLTHSLYAICVSILVRIAATSRWSRSGKQSTKRQHIHGCCCCCCFCLPVPCPPLLDSNGGTDYCELRIFLFIIFHFPPPQEVCPPPPNEVAEWRERLQRIAALLSPAEDGAGAGAWGEFAPNPKP